MGYIEFQRCAGPHCPTAQVINTHVHSLVCRWCLQISLDLAHPPLLLTKCWLPLFTQELPCMRARAQGGAVSPTYLLDGPAARHDPVQEPAEDLCHHEHGRPVVCMPLQARQQLCRTSVC